MRIILLLTMFLASTLSQAVPITYYYAGNGSGNVDGVTFGATDFIITAVADTDNIRPWVDADIQNTHLSASIEIDGVGIFDLITPTHTWITEGAWGGFGESLGLNYIDIDEGGFSSVGYQLDTSLGPVVDTSPGNVFSDVNQFYNVNTSGGILDFYDIYEITFTAVTNVPVPASVWFFGSCLIGLVGVKCEKARRAS